MSGKNVLKRIGQILIVLLGISFLTFILTYLAPGDPVRIMLSSNGTIPTEEVVQAYREEMGLNRPLMVRYVSWLFGCLHGDFGTSYSFRKPVTEVLLSRLWPTMKLALLSMVIMLVIAVPFGMLAALHRNSWIDYLLRGYSFLGVSIPNFWFGLMLMLLFCVQLNLLPVVSSAGDFKSMILPACTLGFAMSAKYARQVRAAVLDELTSDYVVGAQARGISHRSILWKNVFPNSLLPLVTMFGLSMGSLLGGTNVVEIIFSYPGLGSMAVSAIIAYDYPLIQGYVLWVALIYMVINLLVDISYNFIDPRMRVKRN